MDRRWGDRRRGALGFVENYADLSDEEAWHQTRTTGRRLEAMSPPSPDFPLHSRAPDLGDVRFVSASAQTKQRVPGLDLLTLDNPTAELARKSVDL